MRSKRLLMVIAFAALPGLSSGQADPTSALPKQQGKPILATVNGEAITLDEFYQQLAAVHEAAMEGGEKIHKQNPSELLNRLITIKLVLQEARNIGLNELPEVKSTLEAQRRDLLSTLLLKQRARSVGEPDKKDVDRLYAAEVKEYKIRSVLIEKEQDASAFVEAVRAGRGFETVAAEAEAKGSAKGGAEPQTVKAREMLPSVADAVSKLAPGQATSVIRVAQGFTVVKLLEVVLPEDPQARARATKQALKDKQGEALVNYVQVLRDQYTRVNRKVFDALDFEAKEPGFDKLLIDTRVVAEVQGEPPVTVGDLASKIQAKFFHGPARAIEKKRVNAKKAEVLEDILSRRVVLKEALRLKLDQTEEYKNQMGEYSEGILFGTFVQKVIRPEVKIEEAELQKYLEAHARDFSTPEMVRLEALSFIACRDAEQAIGKLRRGADLQWMRANAEGQADPALLEDPNPFGGGLLVLSDLPDDLRAALAGARSGDYRLYEQRGGPCHAVLVREQIPAKPQPLEAVRDEVAVALFNQKSQKAIEDWAAKLRAASEVKVFADPDTLNVLVKQEISSGR
jgi:parvulin-like peptidyl-prolyl isomerase